MNQIAVKATLSDYPWMPRRAKSTYVPPKDTGTISLSQALLGTERVPDARQLNFLGKAKNIGDQKIFYAGDLSLLKCPCVSIVGSREVSDSGGCRHRMVSAQTFGRWNRSGFRFGLRR
jgi:hypothetical protein